MFFSSMTTPNPLNFGNAPLELDSELDSADLLGAANNKDPSKDPLV